MKEKEPQQIHVALVGNPNVGKSSLFNELTGLNQKVGNFPGVTIEKKEGKVAINDELTANVIDLPGIYNLSAQAEDERITTNYLENGKTELIIVVADATNLKRTLLLCADVLELGIPLIIALNMMDLAERNDISIDISSLSKQLNVPIVPLNARIGKGIGELKKTIAGIKLKPASERKSQKINGHSIEEMLARFQKINATFSKYVSYRKEEQRSITISKKIDNILIHPVYGYFFFLLILFVIFQAIFSWSAYPMNWIENGFGLLGNWIRHTMPAGVLTDLLVNGIIAGLGGIVIFIPQIALLFVFLSALEDTGYLSRVSFLMDRSLRKFGLNGKSVIPLLSGTACAVPAILSTRSIHDRKERMITIFVTPLMSCSARIPVYTLLIAMMTPENATLGIFNLQGVLMLSLYVIGAAAAIGSGYLLNLFMKSPKKIPFIFEVPIYRAPRWKSIIHTVYLKVKAFVLEAGKIIIAISIVLWALSSYGPQKNNQNEEVKITQVVKAPTLEASYAGLFGKKIEPLIKPLGFDWKIGISLITSFAAREVFVSTMATIYSVGDENNFISMKEKMQRATWPDSNDKVYTTATLCSLLIFYAFALQCMSTIAVVKKETGSWKWPIFQLLYLSSLAYISSFFVFNLLR